MQMNNIAFMPKGTKGFQKGHSVPESIRIKIREKKKGKHASPSTEIKKGDKLSLGVKHSKAFKENLSKQRMGKHMSPKTEIKKGQHLSLKTEFKKGISQPKLEDSANWKGGMHKDKKGYVLIYSPNHSYTTNSGYMMEHRLVMEKYLNRHLQKEETVHHKNLVKNDNGIENLFLFPNSKLHVHFHVIKNYYPELTEEGFMELVKVSGKKGSC